MRQGSSGRRLRAGVFIAVTASALLLGSCGPEKIESRWRDRDVVIDGERTEWQGTTVYFEKPGVSVGVLNDADFLYVTLATDRSALVRQILMLGLDVTFESKGEERGEFGIGFPLGLSGAGGARSPRPSAEGRRSEGAGERPSRSGEVPEPRLAPPPEAFDDLAILTAAGRDRRHRVETSGLGIEASLQAGELRLAYELKVPLAASARHLYAIGTRPGDEIEVTLSTPEWEPQGRRRPEGGGFGDPGGAPRGPGGGMGPPGGGMGRGGGPSRRPESFELRAKIRLAEPPIAVTEVSLGE
jgi:hypothetical protein